MWPGLIVGTCSCSSRSLSWLQLHRALPSDLSAIFSVLPLSQKMYVSYHSKAAAVSPVQESPGQMPEYPGAIPVHLVLSYTAKCSSTGSDSFPHNYLPFAAICHRWFSCGPTYRLQWGTWTVVRLMQVAGKLSFFPHPRLVPFIGLGSGLHHSYRRPLQRPRWVFCPDCSLNQWKGWPL